MHAVQVQSLQTFKQYIHFHLRDIYQSKAVVWVEAFNHIYVHATENKIDKTNQTAAANIVKHLTSKKPASQTDLIQRGVRIAPFQPGILTDWLKMQPAELFLSFLIGETITTFVRKPSI